MLQKNSVIVFVYILRFHEIFEKYFAIFFQRKIPSKLKIKDEALIGDFHGNGITTTQSTLYIIITRHTLYN